MNVLIIEDEKALSKELEVFLKKENYLCDIAHTGKEASEKIYINNYDFILLDLGLPDYDGLDLLGEIVKKTKDASIIILTARGAVDDKVKGLNMGADDYLAKPFSLLELQSRMQAITRRKHGLKNNVITIDDFKIDVDNRTVTRRDQSINLTKKEFDLLHYLVLHKNRVLTRLQLTEHIWGNLMEDDFDSNYIDVHIKNLRKKLSAHEPAEWIETVRGLGYRANI
ncbi:MAG: response regulator transcription factor [Bacteroidia bacterium]|nr:response regulator transcription factor [Bacteroidia bacterium]